MALYAFRRRTQRMALTMPPLHLLVHADSPENATRIERALRAGAPSCTVEIVTRTAALPVIGAQPNASGLVTGHSDPDDSEPAAPAPSMTPALRHELNNHLAIIRMLADLLAGDGSLSAAAAAKLREIATTAEAAAQAVRRTKPPA